MNRLLFFCFAILLLGDGCDGYNPLRRGVASVHFSSPQTIEEAVAYSNFPDAVIHKMQFTIEIDEDAHVHEIKFLGGEDKADDIETRFLKDKASMEIRRDEQIGPITDYYFCKALASSPDGFALMDSIRQAAHDEYRRIKADTTLSQEYKSRKAFEVNLLVGNPFRPGCFDLSEMEREAILAELIASAYKNYINLTDAEFLNSIRITEIEFKLGRFQKIAENEDVERIKKYHPVSSERCFILCL